MAIEREGLILRRDMVLLRKVFSAVSRFGFWSAKRTHSARLRGLCSNRVPGRPRLGLPTHSRLQLTQFGTHHRVPTDARNAFTGSPGR